MRKLSDWLDVGNSEIRKIQKHFPGWFQAPWLGRGIENVTGTCVCGGK